VNIDQYRIRTGLLGSDDSYGFNGAFLVPVACDTYRVIASDGEGWKHVSVSRAHGMNPPTWATMCVIKDLFFGEDAWVIQYHPAKTDYINCHPGCLHLWQPLGQEIPKPPGWMVGPASAPR
jgi:hypothetical protein